MLYKRIEYDKRYNFSMHVAIIVAKSNVILDFKEAHVLPEKFMYTFPLPFGTILKMRERDHVFFIHMHFKRYTAHNCNFDEKLVPMRSRNFIYFH